MKSKNLEKLTTKQLHALPHLVVCQSYEEAARQAGVTAKQIYIWLKIPLFEEELERQRRAVFMTSMMELRIATKLAVGTLTEALSDENVRNRISAADKILSHALHSVELYEIGERLDMMEKRVNIALEHQEKTKGKL